MNQSPNSIHIVDKDTLKQRAYPDEDVLSDPKMRKERQSRLEMAVMYGNTAYYKVKLIFRDTEGLKSVYSTMWDIRHGQAVLKGGVKIPVHRITEVVFP